MTKKPCTSSLNVYPEFQEVDGISREGVTRSAMFYVIFTAAILYTLSTRLTQATSVTDSYPKPTLATYKMLTSSAPVCPCSSANGVCAVSDTVDMNSSATWMKYRLSSDSNMCVLIHKLLNEAVNEDIPYWTENYTNAIWDDFLVWDMMCISLMTAQESALINALSTTVPLTYLMSEASLTSIVMNTFRQALQLQVIAWGEIVLNINVAYTNNLRYPSFAPFSDYNLTASNIAHFDPLPPLNLARDPFEGVEGINDVFSLAITNMFTPLATPSFFRPADFSRIAQDMLTVNYAAYYGACKPVKCDVSRVMDWKEQLLEALTTLGGFGSFLYTFVYWVPVSLRKKAANKVAPSDGSPAGESLQAKSPAGESLQVKAQEHSVYTHSGTTPPQA